MKITIVCSDPKHPIQPELRVWCAQRRTAHDVELVEDVRTAAGGDILFLISCSQIVPKTIRDGYAATLVVHASDLPAGRGWSPLIWQILEGRNEILVTLLEADDPVDSGRIWAQRTLKLQGTELHDEIHMALFSAELELMDFAIDSFAIVVPMPQASEGASWYRKRVPEDSRIDPQRSLADQFNLLRIADPERYPAFFDFRGERYVLTIRKQPRDE